MIKGTSRQALLQVQAALDGLANGTASDAQLLDRFVTTREEAAFSTLLQRYARMVLHVCRRVLPAPQDAEDAFQATFLLLVKKAGTIRKAESVASWLHGTAYRIATHLRRQSARRAEREKKVQAPPSREPGFEAAWRELQEVLDEEVAGLPPNYRAPLVLCCLEGKTFEEVGSQLGWPVGTVHSRVARAREALRRRLARRGLELPAALLGTVLAVRTLSASVPPALASRTAAAGARVAEGGSAAGLVSARAAALTEGALKTMLLAKLSLGLFLALSVGAAYAFLDGPEPGPAPRPADEKPAASRPADPPAKEAGTPKPGRDVLGDPLPPGALARLGSPRLFGAVGRPVFTPDSKAVIASDRLGALHFWEVASGRELRRLDPAPVENAQQVLPEQLALSGDGRLVVSRHGQFEIFVRDAQTGKLVRKIGGQPGSVFAFTLSPDGKTVAVPRSIYDQREVSFKVQAWDVATGKSLPDFVIATYKANRFLGFGGPANPVSVAIAPDGKHGAVGLSDGDIRVWELATGKEVRQLQGHRNMVLGLVYSPDGKSLASVSSDETIRVWDPAAGGQTKVIEARGLRRAQQFEFQAQALAFAADGKRVVLNGRSPVRTWDVGTGEEVRLTTPDLQPVNNFAGVAYTQVLSPDGKALATTQPQQFQAEQGARLRLHDPSNGKSLHDFAGHDGPVHSLAVAGSGLIATGGADHTVRLWDGRTGRQLKVLRGHVSPVTYLAFSPDGRRLASACGGFGGQDRVISVWDAGSGKEVRQFRWHQPPRGLAFVAGGKHLVVMGRETVWDVETGKQVRELPDTEGYRISSALSPDGRRMACSRIVPAKDGGFQNAKTVVDLVESDTGKEVGSFDPTPSGAADGERFLGQLALGPGGRALLGRFAQRNEYALWDTATGRQLRVIPRPGGIGGQGFFDGSQNWAYFTPDGRLLVHAGQQGKVHVMEVASGEDRRAFEAGPAVQQGLTALALAADGKTLVTASIDGTALVWDLAAAPAGPAAKDLESLWADLAAEAPKAGPAVAALAAMPNEAVAFIAGKARPAMPLDVERVERLIRDLDSTQMPVRKDAESALEKLGLAAKPFVEKALKNKPSLNAAQRLETLLEKIETSPLPPETIRQVRAVEALEATGTPGARQVIEKLAGGAEGDALTLDARAALERLKAKAK